MSRDSVRAQFSKLMRELSVPDSYSDQQKAHAYQLLSSFIYDHLPDTLYRYRSFREDNLHIDALKNDQLWLSIPDRMMDKLDSRLVFDTEKVTRYALNEIESILNSDLAQQLFQGQINPNAVEQFKRISGLDPLPLLAQRKGDLSIFRDVNHLLKFFKDSIPYYIQHTAEENETLLQHTRRISCLCESVAEERMWDEYADGGTGFAVAYHFPKDKLICGEEHTPCGNAWLSYPIFPVIYNEAYDTTQIMQYQVYNALLKQTSNYEMPFFDWLFFVKGYLYKEAQYSFEKEWRLLSKMEKPVFDGKEFDFIPMKVVAIYCGPNILKENRLVLEEIATRKEIDFVYIDK